MPESDRSLWKMIDAQLCIVIKSTIHDSVKNFFTTLLTCETVWKKAKIFDIGDTRRLYQVCQNFMRVVGPRRLDGSMADYLDKIQGLLHDFNEIMPPAGAPTKEYEQRETFFMMLALCGLPMEYSLVRNQILDSPIGPTFNSAMSTLLLILEKSSLNVEVINKPVDSSASAFQSGEYGRSRKHGKSCPKCDHCHMIGHTIDRCFDIHGRPPQTTNVAQTAQVASSQTRLPPSHFRHF